ncbi:MAG: Gfo/Idh/MocA family oxidoreductase [Opitutales bacterium]|nr:Gfo/Idh/MocA family oxidoreductase [Opitutales bacterium]
MTAQLGKYAPIRIGFIGAGENTRLRHLPGFKAIPGVELAAVANRSRASATAVAETWGVTQVCDCAAGIIEDPAIDAVCIGTWPDTHAALTIAALEAGKHVLVEARMAANLAEARRMVAASGARPQQVAQIVPSPFSLDLDATVADFIASGRLGELEEIRIHQTWGLFLDPAAPISWRQRQDRSGVNILTFGIFHEIAERWFPDLVLRRVTACGFNRVPERPDPEHPGRTRRVDIPDRLEMRGETTEGVALNYRFSAIEMGPPESRVELVGSRARLVADLSDATLTVFSGSLRGEGVSVPAQTRRGWCVEADFVDSIRLAKPVRLTSFQNGLRYMAVTQAVYDSVYRGGPWVDVETL